MRSTRPKLIVFLVGAVAFTAARATPVPYPPPPFPDFPGIRVGGSAAYLYTQVDVAPPYDATVAHHSTSISAAGVAGIRYGSSDYGSSIEGLSRFDGTTYDGRADATAAVRPGYVSTNTVDSQLSLQINDGLTPFSLDGSLPIGTPVTIEVTARLDGTDAIAASGGGTGSVSGSAGGTLNYDGAAPLVTSYQVDPTQASATWSRSATAFVIGYIGYTSSFSFATSGAVSATASTDAAAMALELAGLTLDFQAALSFSTTMSGVGLFSLSGAPYAAPGFVPEPAILSLLAIGGALMIGRRRYAS